MENRLKDLAITLFTETKTLNLHTNTDLNAILRLNSEEIVDFVKLTVVNLGEKIRKCDFEIRESEGNANLEEILQKREAELREKTKIEFELRLELAEMNKIMRKKAENREIGVGTEPELPTIDVTKSLLDDPAKEERGKFMKIVSHYQISAKRDQQIISDLERKLSRLEVLLLEMTDQLAEKTRECERWRKDCTFLSLSSRNKDFLPVAFTENRRKLVRKRDVKSNSPVKNASLWKENTAKSGLGRQKTPGSLRSLAEGYRDSLEGKAVVMVPLRNSSVREISKGPLLRKPR